ncbi:GlmU family protein [Pontibacter flavimaris]|uniref:Glucose-1-phosphate thymidylyltransferase n=1 Tax=Pontibacter flavimaris TaxID=1797110 RepID=A0A1Q5PA67_9BACT|nr:GlmU family protein [Pontibacter flavimaris]OKL39136.1 glucose-1-phosphate thymidylyltransferase [Pontibacter flavimaris]
MNFILFDDTIIRQDLLPLTFTRPVAGVRVGILTIAEKWARHLGGAAAYLTQPYLQPKYNSGAGGQGLYINGAVIPDAELAAAVRELKPSEALRHNGLLIALHSNGHVFETPEELASHTSANEKAYGDCTVIRDVWDIFLQNGSQIRSDYTLVTAGRQSQPINDRYTMVYNEENIFVEEGVKIRAAILNAENGPIYLGKNSQVHEGAVIKGPFSLGEESNVNVGGKMRGDVSIGPFCKIGGEVAASVIFGYTNKGHEGYLGNSVLGEWINIGADTNTSNLKNNYAEVKVWNYAKGSFKNSGQQFCGLIMGDHSKCGINTMFNTGTVVGVSANIYGPGFPRQFIPSFSWGGAAGFVTFQLPKAMELAEKVMSRRNLHFGETEQSIFQYIFEQGEQYRIWDKKV